MPVKRVEQANEWRDARRFVGGVQYSVDLGSPAPGSVLRLGIADAGEQNTVHARLQAGGRILKEWTTAGTGQWEDLRLELPKESEDCRLILESPAAFAVAPCEIISPNPQQPNVLIFLIDTLRQDHLGCYGYGRDTSPNIDAFAKDAVRFTDLMPQSSWTKPSVASLLTSTYPGVHGGQDRPDVLRPNLPTLGGALAAAGFEPHCFMSNRTCIPMWGFGDEFFRFLDVDSEYWVDADDGVLVDRVLDTLDFVAGRPWFFYVHAMGPHEPYKPPAPYDAKFTSSPPRSAGDAERNEAVNLYDGEIAYTDAQFGRLVQKLKDMGLYQNTMIIVLADHGQEFWEHGETGHGLSLFEEQLRVPFLIKLPGEAHAGTSRTQLVEMVDVAPTILDLLGLSPNPRFQGASFRGVLDDNSSGKEVGFASLLLESRRLTSAKAPTVKYIHDLRNDSEQWYNLAEDPQEAAPMTAPSGEGEHLAHYAQRLARLGQHGLQVLVVNDGRQERAVRGQLSASAMASYEIDYVPERTSAALHEGQLEFQFDMQPAGRDGHVPAKWQRVLDIDPFYGFVADQIEFEPDSAQLRVEVGDSAELQLTLWLDDKPLEELITPAGPRHRNPHSQAFSLSAADIVGEANAFDPASLAGEFAVYVWFVPPVATVADEDLDPDLKQALEALGYIE